MIRIHWACFQLDQSPIEYVLICQVAHAKCGKGSEPQWRKVMDRLVYLRREVEDRYLRQVTEVWIGDTNPTHC